jgi:hypothetical protein
MNEKNFRHLIRTVQDMYQNITTITRKDCVNDNTHTGTNKEVQQGCPLSLVLFNTALTEALKNGCR